MEICALASGSSGNCFYIENRKNSGILIDAGITCKQIEERLGKIGKKPENIKAMFITHEHSDHTRGADVLGRKFNIPIFATKKTIKSRFLCNDEKLINTIKNNETLQTAGLQIEAFSKSHRAEDPVSYNVINHKRVSIITDAGHACKNVISNVADADFLFLESNYDELMLKNGPYPSHVKAWIKSDIGHLSNTQSGLCVLEHGSRKLKNVVLSHISENNNMKELALKTFNSLIKERKDLRPNVSLSCKEAPTKVFRMN
jgi:phosphoribosyl 1,2-cyclic phosphodiesterase